MSADPTKPSSSAQWREQATIKLVGRRREALMRLARRESPGCSPVDAIDRAIDLALAEREESSSIERRLDAIEDTLEAMDFQRRAEAERTLAALAKLNDGIARLHALIAEAAAGDESSY